LHWSTALCLLLGFLLGQTGLAQSSGIPVDEVEVEAAKNVTPPQVTSKPVLTSPGDISGRLVDIDGISAHAKVKLKLMRLPDQTVIAESITDNAGNYAFSGIQAGEYNLQIGQAMIRVLAAQGLPAQPLNLVLPKALVTAAAAAGAAAGVGTAVITPITWTTATWAGGTVVVVVGGTVGVLAATGNLNVIGLADDEEDEVTVTTTPKKTLPPTPPPPPSTLE
jgi:hypothetical protein